MSKTNRPDVTVGCPECGATVGTNVPPPLGIDSVDPTDPNRLRGVEISCENCGHDLDWYYY